MAAEDPTEFAKAEEVERRLQLVDDEVTLHQSGLNLVDAVRTTAQISFDFDTERCDSGYCFT